MQVHRLADPGNAPGTLPASLALPSFRVALTAVFAALFIVIAGAATAVEQRRSLRQLPPRQGPAAMPWEAASAAAPALARFPLALAPT